MKCEQIRDLLSPYMDQMTDSQENNAIIAHLAACPDCREELKQLEAMRDMMGNLYTPQLPDTFAQDLRQRLNDGKKIILKPRYLKTPSKAGWIAAAVAVVALAAGIFSSNYLPVDNIIAYHEQQTQVTDKKTTKSVNDILDKIKVWDNQDKNTEAETDEIPVQEPAPITVIPADQQPVEEIPPVIVEPAPEVKIADIYSTRIKVDSTEEAVDKIIQIAQASQADYDVNAASSMVQALSAGSTKMVEIKADAEKVDSIIEELEPMGMIAAPMHDETILTDEYAKALQQIEIINEQMDIAKADNNTEELQKLNQDMNLWTARQAVIDKEISQATIRVYLIEEVKP